MKKQLLLPDEPLIIFCDGLRLHDGALYFPESGFLSSEVKKH